jgi:hypothetical protein
MEKEIEKMEKLIEKIKNLSEEEREELFYQIEELFDVTIIMEERIKYWKKIFHNHPR